MSSIEPRSPGWAKTPRWFSETLLILHLSGWVALCGLVAVGQDIEGWMVGVVLAVSASWFLRHKFWHARTWWSATAWPRFLTLSAYIRWFVLPWSVLCFSLILTLCLAPVHRSFRRGDVILEEWWGPPGPIQFGSAVLVFLIFWAGLGVTWLGTVLWRWWRSTAS